MTGLVNLMGRPRSNAHGPETPARKVVLQMKGTEEWKGWLDRFSKFLRMPTSAVADNALVEYAKARGFNEPAPER